MTSFRIAAIDPGLKGAISFSTPEGIATHPMPIAGKQLDLPTLASLIKEANPEIAFIEKVASMPGQGVSSSFTFGCGYGMIQGILAGLGVPFELVTPQAWKKVILAGTKKDKDAAIAYCRRAFPETSLILARCRVPHDGIADSLCILKYGQRIYSKGL